MEIVLGDFIKLVGFSEIPRDQLFVVKRIIGPYVKKIEAMAEKLQEVSLHLEAIHRSEDGHIAKYEMHVKVVDNGKVFSASAVHANLFKVIDEVMNSVLNELKKEHKKK